jgi:uncharacterized protein YhhL (DUF1145 family)
MPAARARDAPEVSMNADVLRTGQKALNVVWIVLALSFVLPMGTLGGVLQGVAMLMLAAHLLEFVVFARSLSKLGGSLGGHFVKVLLYGFFHVQLAKLEAGEAGVAH